MNDFFSQYAVLKAVSDIPLLQSAIDATMESTNKTAINTQLTQITSEVKQSQKEIQQEVD